MPRRADVHLKHYRELKMTGRFEATRVEELFHIALGVSLGKYDACPLAKVPVDDVRLYDVTHTDTGTRRPINKRGDTVRVYRSSMREVTSQPLKAPVFALESVILEGVGHPGRVGVGAEINGRLSADLRDIDIRDGFKPNDITEMRRVLKEQEFMPMILGTLVVGQAFSFGEPRFNQPPGENFDRLITLGSFNDLRYQK